MVALHVTLLVTFLATSTCGLQVTPNSACASVCLDNSTQDPSDPNVSNTYGSDIVCKDGDYNSTAVGQKFQTCINCLQNSRAVSSGENDQAWFLYNLRFAFNTCIFGTANASDPVTTPCGLSTACGPIQGALEDGIDSPATMGQYSYCAAYDNSFVGSFLGTCKQCLKENANESIFSNFLIALDAACTQQPIPGVLIGLNSSVFTENEVQITYPRIPPSTTSNKKVLTVGAIIGIAISGVVLLSITIAILFICAKKRRNLNSIRRLKSPLDSRFGAKNISAPNRGAFASPHHSLPLAKESVQMRRTPRPLNFSRNTRPRPNNLEEHAGEHTPLTAGPPSYSPPNSGRDSVIPAHAAYIPHQHTPPSRNSVSPAFIPHPPTTYPQRSMSNTSAAAVRISTQVPPIVTRNASNASRFRTRDLSRDRSKAPTPVQQISGPIIKVGSRFENETQAKAARERLYKEGLRGSTMVHDPQSKEIEERHSPESDVSEEMWPGNY